jgi:hypothetical protein
MSVTTNAAGDFVLNGLSAGRYVVEVVGPTGGLIGSSAPVTLTGRDMRMAGLLITPSAGIAKTGVVAGTVGGGTGGGSFFTSTAGIILLAAAGAGVTAAVIVANDSASPSR